MLYLVGEDTHYTVLFGGGVIDSGQVVHIDRDGLFFLVIVAGGITF